MLNEISRDAILAGVNPNDVVNYISTLSSKDIVNLFKAANVQQQPAQVQQPVQTTQNQYNSRHINLIHLYSLNSNRCISNLCNRDLSITNQIKQNEYSTNSFRI